jgi:hypothetical protein
MPLQLEDQAFDSDAKIQILTESFKTGNENHCFYSPSFLMY